MLVVTLCALVAACDGKPTWKVTYADGGGTPNAAVSVAIALAGDACGVVAADATVSAWDMATVGPVSLQIVDDTISGTIPNVPAGPYRTLTVRALDALGVAVYQGSAQVTVTAGATTHANVVLSRTGFECGGTPNGSGTIEVTGSIQGVTFSFADSALTSDGVIHLFDPSTDRIRRLDLETREFLTEIQGSATLDAISWAVAPDGAIAYLGYAGGRIDAVDLATGTKTFFAAAASTVSSMIVAGDYLFTIDDSGAWDSHSLYHRTSRARVATDEWRNTARSMVYSSVQQRVYLLDSGVSPTDVHMVTVDQATGTLGLEVDSPYHGNYFLPNPIRLLPDESGVIVGSGIIFDAVDLTYETSLGLSFADVAFLGDRLYLVDAIGATTQLRVLSSGFDILSAEYFAGSPRRLFAYGGELVLLTQGTAGLEVRFLAP
jgi:hypothetical protein